MRFVQEEKNNDSKGIQVFFVCPPIEQVPLQSNRRDAYSKEVLSHRRKLSTFNQSNIYFIVLLCRYGQTLHVDLRLKSHLESVTRKSVPVIFKSYEF